MRCEVISRSGEKIQFYSSSGETVGDFLQHVSSKFKYPESSIRLFYCGKELKPKTKLLESFDIGKFGNLIHMTTTTVDVVDNSNDHEEVNFLPRTRSTPTFIDLTNSNEVVIPIDLVNVDNNGNSSSTSSGMKRKMSSVSSSVTNLTNLTNLTNSENSSQSTKALRLNISRALHHRLCIIETRVLDVTNSMGNAVEYVIQGSEGIKDRHRVFLGTSVSCSCEDSLKSVPCRHILFILIKVFKFPSESLRFNQNPISFTESELKDLLISKGYISSLDNGVLYSGERSAVVIPTLATTSTNSSTTTTTTNTTPINSTVVQPTDNSKNTSVALEIVHEPEECCVCLRELVILPESKKCGDNLVVCRNCNKQIHQFCIEQWQNRSETCPYCRCVWLRKKQKKTKKSR